MEKNNVEYFRGKTITELHCSSRDDMPSTGYDFMTPTHTKARSAEAIPSTSQADIPKSKGRYVISPFTLDTDSDSDEHFAVKTNRKRLGNVLILTTFLYFIDYYH